MQSENTEQTKLKNPLLQNFMKIFQKKEGDDKGDLKAVSASAFYKKSDNDSSPSQNKEDSEAQ